MKASLTLVFCLFGYVFFGQSQCPYLNVHGEKVYPQHPFSKSFKKFYHKPEKMDSLIEADVMSARQFVKVINFKEKTNQLLFQHHDPKNSYYTLFDILVFGVMQEKIHAFKTGIFSKPNAIPLTCEQFNTRIFYLDSVNQVSIDSSGIETQASVLKAEFIKSIDIKEFRVNEVWYFNKKWGQIEKRIVGMSPVWNNPKTGKDEELFWIYFPEAQDLLASFPANSKSIYSDMKSFEEIFAERFFSCYIKKENNLFNRDKTENGKAIDDLIESERAKEKVLKSEDDMWEK
ncbi:MAG: gliding motility protein GldN [Bacteroidota bacterium]|nr:gliding motility protein GldN [Bacteroidota bacterium]